MGGEDEPLVGFSWRGGFERDTTGILMWSKPFITTLRSGEQVSGEEGGRSPDSTSFYNHSILKLVSLL